MLGATINNYHTYDDFGLSWLGMSISEAEVKTHYIEIEGRDGALDAAEALSGRPVYKQRTLTLSFDARSAWENEYMTRCSRLDSLTSGMLVKTVLDIDLEYFYVGRGKWKHTKTADGDESHIFTVTIEPFKYRKELTEVSVTVERTTDVTLTNLKAPSYPLLTTADAGLQVQYGAVTYLIPVGTDVPAYDITLLEGGNALTFTGSGTVKIKYQEGIL